MMRRIGPDTAFSRLFAIVLGAVIASHFSIIFTLIMSSFGRELPQDSVQVLVDGAASPAPPTVLMMHPALVVGAVLRDLWPVLGTVFLFLVVAAWYSAKMLTAPIRRLSEAAERLSDSLDSSRIPEEGPREARQAARVFNRLRDRITAQIQQRAVFLAAISHDLRTPLTRMKLRVERVADDDLKDKLRADLNEMATMLNATLEFLRGEVESEPWQMFDVQALAESLAEDAEETGHPVIVAGDALPIMAKPTLLRRCLSNLIENALRYGHTAKVSLRDDPATLVIEVQDDGPGIPENELTAVFEPFVRLESSRNKNSGGVGLGLSIAREAAQRHGGDLTLRNGRTGGLIARLSIPRNR
jgi:protein-histidine pros-kinase